MINAYRNKFIKQHLELYGEELFLDSSSKKPGGEFSELSKTDLLNNLHSKIDIELVPKKGTVLDKVVFGSGDPNADLLFVGESPSIRELENNKPFLGKSGNLLDKILKAIGYNRSSKVYLTHLIKSRIEGSRDPLKSEINKFIPFLNKQINIIEPKIIVGLGKVVGKALVNKNLSIDIMRSKICIDK